MAIFLLDTDTLIDVSRRFQPTLTHVGDMIRDGNTVGVCAVNVAEFYTGLTPQQLPVWDAFFGALAYWDVSLSAARQAGRYRYDFARAGLQLPATDTLVAAVAFEVGAVVVTSNERDYPMADVQTLNPRIP